MDKDLLRKRFKASKERALKNPEKFLKNVFEFVNRNDVIGLCDHCSFGEQFECEVYPKCKLGNEDPTDCVLQPCAFCDSCECEGFELKAFKTTTPDTTFGDIKRIRKQFLSLFPTPDQRKNAKPNHANFTDKISAHSVPESTDIPIEPESKILFPDPFRGN